jgi:hypothetical protein
MRVSGFMFLLCYHQICQGNFCLCSSSNADSGIHVHSKVSKHYTNSIMSVSITCVALYFQNDSSHQRCFAWLCSKEESLAEYVLCWESRISKLLCASYVSMAFSRVQIYQNASTAERCLLQMSVWRHITLSFCAKYSYLKYSSSLLMEEESLVRL